MLEENRRREEAKTSEHKSALQEQMNRVKKHFKSKLREAEDKIEREYEDKKL